MTDTMTHRGPDDSGYHFDGPFGMGMRRLSIIDLEGGAQPIANEGETVWVVSNGEIYNFRELRKELESHGHVFRTHSDCEVVVHVYEEWGVEGLARLNGMFGLAIWDSPRRLLVLARDPFGVKPLYYRDVGGTLLFGSEMRPILCHPGVNREVDLTGLQLFASLTYVPSPRTAFSGIWKVRPGHAVLCDSNGVKHHRFHRVAPDLFDGVSEGELIEELRTRIRTAVERQMVADVPVGAMLSGGVDSSTVVTLMTEIAGAPVDTFTVGFQGDFEENELDDAREMAARLGSRHHEVSMSASDYADFLPRSIWHLEEPVATTSTMAFHRVCALAREHVKVALTGQGADEPFGGYPRYLGERYGALVRAVPAALRDGVLTSLVGSLPRNERAKRAIRSLGNADSVGRMAAVYDILGDQLASKLLLDSSNLRDEMARSVAYWQQDVSELDGVSQMMYVDARTSLPDNLLLYGDKMSMAVSLEARVPFLDLELMEFVERIPPRLKIKGRKQKHILKKAVAKWLPDEVIRRRKVGFATPMDGWLRGCLNDETRDKLLDKDSACLRYFDARTVERMLSEHATGRHDHKRALFCLLTFEIWHEQFIRPAKFTAPAAVA